MNNNEQLLKDSIFKVGKVTSVKGRSIEVEVDKTKNTSHLLYKGSLLKNVSVGSYVKILKGFIKIIGKIDGEYIKEDKISVKTEQHSFEYREQESNRFKKTYGSQKEKISRILNISLLGFFGERGFERGIKELPLIDNECFLLEKEEFRDVHSFIKEGDDSITIGSLSLEKGQPIKLGINSLFASHIGIFGNTGSGKSYTLAKILRELFKKYSGSKNFKENGKFLLFDFNGEYAGDDIIILKKHKNIYKLSINKNPNKNPEDKFPITKENINDPAFWLIFLTATEKTQTPFLKRTLKKTDIDSTQIENTIFEIITNADKKVDRGVIFQFLEEIKFFLKNEINIQNLRSNLKYHSTNNTYYALKNSHSQDNYYIYGDSAPEELFNKIKEYLSYGRNYNYIFKLKKKLSDLEKIQVKIIYHYYNEIVRGFSHQEHLSPLIKRLEKRVSDLDNVIQVLDKEALDQKLKNFLTVISLKEVNTEIKKILPLLICKQLYEDKKKQNQKNKFLNIIIDEAHNILSKESFREAESWKDYRLETFEEIIKEGRKFGVFLTIASQRPYDISPTIISQLHNYFLHRLINNHDITAIERAIAYLDKLSVEYLSILPTGTCILAGLLTHVPVIVDIGQIKPKKHEPDNKTIELTTHFKD